MNKTVGEDVGALLGKVLEVRSDVGGTTIGRCICIRAQVDIHKPLLRWTNVNIGGTPCRIMFRYEKLAEFCYYCGPLDHMDKNCKHTHPDEMQFYGHWLRANGQNPTNMKEIAAELDRLNPKKPTPLLSQSPRTPTNRDLFTPYPTVP